MTNAERKKIARRVSELNFRIASLQRVDKISQLEKFPVIEDIIKEYNNEITRLNKSTNERREYLYNFIGGGWNSEWAYTVEEAIEQAQTRWAADSPKLRVDMESFRVSTPSDYSSLLSMFN